MGTNLTITVGFHALIGGRARVLQAPLFFIGKLLIDHTTLRRWPHLLNGGSILMMRAVVGLLGKGIRAPAG